MTLLTYSRRKKKTEYKCKKREDVGVNIHFAEKKTEKHMHQTTQFQKQHVLELRFYLFTSKWSEILTIIQLAVHI